MHFLSVSDLSLLGDRATALSSCAQVTLSSGFPMMSFDFCFSRLEEAAKAQCLVKKEFLVEIYFGAIIPRKESFCKHARTEDRDVVIKTCRRKKQLYRR